MKVLAYSGVEMESNILNPERKCNSAPGKPGAFLWGNDYLITLSHFVYNSNVVVYTSILGIYEFKFGNITVMALYSNSGS